MLAAEEAKASGALWLDGFASWRNVQEQQQEGPRHGRGGTVTGGTWPRGGAVGRQAGRLEGPQRHRYMDWGGR